MATPADHAAWPTQMLLIGAAIFVAGYALVAAWLVAAGDDVPEPLQVEWTEAGDGVVVSGAVADADDGEELIAAIVDATGAPVIISELETDSDADPIEDPEAVAADLLATLP